MRGAFKYLTSLLFLTVVVQVALAGYGAFNATSKADDNDTVSGKTITDGYNAHAVVGTVIVALMIILLLVALAARLGRPWVPWSGGLLILGIAQMLLAWLGDAVPALGFLHAVNALVIYAGIAMLAHRAWMRPAAAPAAPA
jgi:hypothetical protein